MTLQDLFGLTSQLGAGAAFLLVIGIIAFQKEWIFSGAAYRRADERHTKELAEKDRQIAEWKALALHSTEMVGGAIEVAKK